MILADARQGMTARRWTVLQAVAATFAERGFQGVGMREVGLATGLNPGTLYHHFKSKDDALLNVCRLGQERTLADLEAVLSRHAGLAPRIDALFACHIQSLVKAGDFIQVYSNHRLELPPAMSPPLTEGWEAYRRSLQRMFDEAIAGGEIEAGLNPGHLGRMLIGQIRIVNQLHRKGRAEEIPDFVTLATRMFLGAVRADA
ncbi:TetR/AcrR family transcriptional regulator [Brevundimonas sp.]|uniref:TetR/AcrR family transcriptional regulator n=1 Tax=Brevundimonas sp. TaxID=1871086 RepID=UPI0037832D63